MGGDDSQENGNDQSDNVNDDDFGGKVVEKDGENGTQRRDKK